MERLDIKGKFKTFISDSKLKLLSPGAGAAGQDGDDWQLILPQGAASLDRGDWSDSDREVSQLQGDPLADQEVLDSLDKIFYAEDSDPSLHCLNLLGDMVGDLQSIDESRKALMQQLTTVSRRVFSLILEKQGDCARQLEGMVEVQADLLDSLAVCRTGRANLAKAQDHSVSCSLGILAGWRRRQQALALLSNLETIRTLSLTQERLQELLGEENYPEAISLLLECTKVSSTFGHFSAIHQLSGKLADTLVMTEEQLDQALARQCTNFNAETYGKLQQAYRLLGKTQTSMDQLLMHFTTAIHNHSFAVVYGHVCLITDCPRPPPYPELCKEVAVESFLPALTDLLKSLWTIMLSYHRLLLWHSRTNQEEDEGVRQYCMNKLETGVGRVWQDVQSKVKAYVLASDLSQFSIDSFLHFLDLLHRLIMVGQEFSGSNSSALLQDSLVTQCRAYFSTYHATRLDELKVHLENEAWTVCPVKQDFNFRLLAEFSHLSTLKSPTKSLSGSSSWLKRFSGVNSDESPFDELCQESQEEDILLCGDETGGCASSDSEDELSAEQMQELLEENRDSGRVLTHLTAVVAPSKPPIARATGLTISNTAIMLLRLVGRYSHMMKVLSPIADTVWLGICQLFEFYLFTVNQFFTFDLADMDKAGVYSSKLAATLTSIQARVIEHEETVEGQEEIKKLVGSVRPASLCPGVVLDGIDLIAGLPERLVGVESTVFIASQFSALLPLISSSLPDHFSSSIDAFHDNVISAAVDLREPIFLAAVARSMNTDGILGMMARVSWDIKEVSTQHSPYVDQLLRELSIFSQRVIKVASMVSVSDHLSSLLWRQAVRVAINTFVEGFAAAKKCTNEGRALMQLDFRQFVIQAEKLSSLKPLPFQDFVTVFVKAFYIQEAELEQWVADHPEYSASQLRAVVQGVTNSNSSNKTKQKLNSLINDLSFKIRR